MAKHERTLVRRPWDDVSPKVIAGALSGVTASGLVWAGTLVGFHLDPALAAVVVTIATAVAGYWKRDSTTGTAGG